MVYGENSLETFNMSFATCGEWQKNGWTTLWWADFFLFLLKWAVCWRIRKNWASLYLLHHFYLRIEKKYAQFLENFNINFVMLSTNYVKVWPCLICTKKWLAFFTMTVWRHIRMILCTFLQSFIFTIKMISGNS